MQMLAAVLHQQSLPRPYRESMPFQIQQVVLDPPGPGEVLVEVRAAGLCNSDVSSVAGSNKRPLPIVGGHEGAGIVREVGAGVSGIHPGDHVVMVNVTGCGHCRWCRDMRPGLCQTVITSRTLGQIATGERRLRMPDGSALHHYSGLSVFAQYTVVVPQSIVVIDKRVPFDVAAMLGCGVLTGAGSVFNTGQVRPGQSVAVVGLGGVGLSAVMAAREAGAATIIGLDPNEGKFGLGYAVGCTHCLRADDPDVVREVHELTDGGVDRAFEMSGAPAAVQLAHAVTARGGDVIHVGVGKGDAQVTVPQWPLVIEERGFRGCMMGGGVPSIDIPRYVDLYLSGKFPIDKLRSQFIRFDDLNGAMDRLMDGEAVRQILLPHGEM